MAVLLLRLAAPLQAWGSNSKFIIRNTEREPTKRRLATTEEITEDPEEIAETADVPSRRETERPERRERPEHPERKRKEELTNVTAER